MLPAFKQKTRNNFRKGISVSICCPDLIHPPFVYIMLSFDGNLQVSIYMHHKPGGWNIIQFLVENFGNIVAVIIPNKSQINTNQNSNQFQAIPKTIQIKFNQFKSTPTNLNQIPLIIQIQLTAKSI